MVWNMTKKLLCGFDNDKPGGRNWIFSMMTTTTMPKSWHCSLSIAPSYLLLLLFVLAGGEQKSKNTPTPPSTFCCPFILLGSVTRFELAPGTGDPALALCTEFPNLVSASLLSFFSFCGKTCKQQKRSSAVPLRKHRARGTK